MFMFSRLSARALLALTLVTLLGASVGVAQIGQAPATITDALASFELTPAEADNTFTVGDMTITLETRGDVVFTASGEGTLDEDGIALASQMIATASGYGDGIADPVGQFFTDQASQIANQGEVTLAVEEYLLDLTITGEDAPYEAAFTLRLAEIPADAFPTVPTGLGASREDATYIIREFSDFQCPFCTRFSTEVLPFIKAELLEQDNVRFEYHHFPLESIHPNAIPAAEASECVRDSAGIDAFWSYHDALFARQNAWGSLGDTDAYFVRLAEDIDVATDELESCIEDRDFAAEVREAYRFAAEGLGLRGTPTVFVNGYRITNPYAPNAITDTIALIDAFAQAPEGTSQDDTDDTSDTSEENPAEPAEEASSETDETPEDSTNEDASDETDDADADAETDSSD
jgi:protein-disulfide isomerase